MGFLKLHHFLLHSIYLPIYPTTTLPMPEVTMLDALEEINPALKLKLILKSLVLFISLCNLMCSFILVQYSNGWTFSQYDFNTSTIDIFILTSVELVLFPIVAYLAVNATRSHLKNIGMLTRLSEKISQCCQRCFPCNNSNSQSSSSNMNKPYSRLPVNDDGGSFSHYNSHSILDGDGAHSQPLLSAYAKGSSESTLTLNESSTSSNSNSNSNSNNSAKDADILIPPTEDNSVYNPLTKPVSSSLEGYEEDDERRKDAKKRIDEGLIQTRGGADQMRAVWLFVMFAFSTVVQVFIGLKCISFSYSNEQLQV